MRKLVLSAVVLGTLAAAAPVSAADMALKAPPPAPVLSWTGWYVGGNVGGSFGRADNSISFGGVPGQPINQKSLDGIIGGGQVGYNWQTGNWVFGLEADIQASSERASSTGLESIPVVGAIVGPNPLTLTDKLAWFGTLRGRIGITASPAWLLYVTGGLAYGEIDTNSSLTVGAATAVNTTDTTRTGWTLGAGAETALGSNWSAKLEYLYIDLGTFANTFAGVGPVFTPVSISTHVTDNVVRVGLNYHFH